MKVDTPPSLIPVVGGVYATKAFQCRKARGWPEYNMYADVPVIAAMQFMAAYKIARCQVRRGKSKWQTFAATRTATTVSVRSVQAR